MVYLALIVGHSCIHRLESFQFQNRRSDRYNLGFDGTDYSGSISGFWWGITKLRPGPKSIQSKRLGKFFIHINQIQFSFRLVVRICVEKNQEKKIVRDISSFAELLLVLIL